MSTQTFVQNGVFYEVIDGVVRREIPKGDGLRRTWHANGALATESQRINGKSEGISKEWHDNGVLAREVPRLRGLVHGIVRQWNRGGKLLGEYEMKMGCGIQKKWADDGKLISEFEELGEGFSRGRIWDDLGRATQVFLKDGKPISKAKFSKLRAALG